MPADDLHPDGPAYEVMYLLDAEDEPHPAAQAGARALWATPWSWSAATGLWNVHVHVDDVGAAIEAGIEAGRPHRIRVTHFAEQVETARDKVKRRTGRRVVVVAAGPGWPASSPRPGPWSSRERRGGGPRRA